MVNISFPVFNHEGLAVAAPTVPYIQSSNLGLSVDETVEHLKNAAAEIALAMGGMRLKF